MFEDKFEKDLNEIHPDFVFSFNFYPIISKVCNKVNIKYVSWVYDSPQVSMYSYTITFPCNYVFVFDSKVYETFRKGRINTVYYLPLAADVDALDNLKVTPEIRQKYGADISFVGQMYTESHTFYDRMEPKLDDWTRGYLEALMNAQKQIYGDNFLEKCLKPEVIERMYKAMPYDKHADGIESREFVYSQYFLCRKITSMDRTEIIRMIGEKHPAALYTPDFTFNAPGVDNRGVIDYYDAMPYVFKCSKINLNITLRSIESGIPLRALDIMGAGGFLLTNFQSDMFSYFTPGVDFEFYEDRDDLMRKIAYYLEHDEEREAIAKNGHNKVAKEHTFDIRVRQMMEIVFG